jgi:hypothetical protein
MTTALSLYVLYVADRSPDRLRSDARSAGATAAPARRRVPGVVWQKLGMGGT